MYKVLNFLHPICFYVQYSAFSDKQYLNSRNK